MVEPVRSLYKTIIKPTEKPSPVDMTKVATDLVMQAQKCILSPSAMVGVLSCALELYAQNLEESGFDPEVVKQSRMLGADMATMIHKSGVVKSNAAKDKAAASAIVTSSNNSPLLGADGNPMVR